MSLYSEFVKLNPLDFWETKPEQDPLEWLEGVQKTLRMLKVKGSDIIELDSYVLKDGFYSYFELWEECMDEVTPPTTWKEFTGAFMANFIPKENQEART